MRTTTRSAQRKPIAVIGRNRSSIRGYGRPAFVGFISDRAPAPALAPGELSAEEYLAFHTSLTKAGLHPKRISELARPRAKATARVSVRGRR